MKKILITGGAGFIGSNLCENLLSEDNYIYCLDDFTSGSKSNIQEFLNNKNFEFIKHNVINPIDIMVDEIYHLACPASPVYYQKDPIKTLKTSIWGINNMLELALKYNAKILYTSTSEVYGDPLVHPQKESYWGNVNPIGIRSCYDEGKRAAETLLTDYRRAYNINAKTVRIFNTFGPKMAQNDGRVISNFITQALDNKDITVYGDGSQTRSICYVDDTISGLRTLMASDFKGPVNIGNNKELTINEIAELIIKLTNSKSKIIHLQLPSDDPKKRRPDLRTAKENLNWEPKTDLIEALNTTIQYFSSNKCIEL
ncbi:MAG: SDR family oxidoreductase [Candidatus Gastranaerophilales bacterium]|nr:SDR family oxidoreductase [Candidatus Gastranaerophilales bacterium]